MAIKILNESEDGKQVTVAKEELESLEEAATQNFNKGYNKAKDKFLDEGRKQVLSKLDFLDIDADDFDGSIQNVKQTFESLKKSSGKGSEQIAALQEQLNKKTNALEKVEGEFNAFKTNMLIDNKVKDLAAQNKAVNPAHATLLFKNEFPVEVDGDNVLVKNPQTGNPMFDEKGDPVTLDKVFSEKFVKNNPHLFQGSGQGGSGGGGSDFGHVTKLSDLKSDSDKSKFIQQHGLEAYRNLIDGAQDKG